MKRLIGTKIQAKIDQEMICSSPNLYLSPSWNPNQGTPTPWLTLLSVLGKSCVKQNSC